MAPETNQATQPQNKKRKRTGKEREERKRAAIQAQQAAEVSAQVGKEEAALDIQAPAAVQNGEDSSETTLVALNPERQQQPIDLEKAAQRIPQALKHLHPVFKQAKTFETRRLIKKLKFIRSKGKDEAELTDLESQLKALHDIRLYNLGQSHLLIKLRKHPLLKQHTLPVSIYSLLKPSIDTDCHENKPSIVMMKAENRLCSAKFVAEKVKHVVSWILGEEGSKLVVEKKASISNSGSKSKTKGSNEESQSEEQEDDDGGFSRSIIDNSDGDKSSDDEQYQQTHAAEAAGWESGSVSESDPPDKDELQTDSDSHFESNDSNAADILQPKRSKISEPSSKSIIETRAKAPKNEKNPKLKQELVSENSKNFASSIFLPSLSAGFTRGDDGDSDPDLDEDPNGIAGKDKGVRKNRRGQRARQAIWEKKYGKSAKHVVKAREGEKEKERIAQEKDEAKARSRDSGWGQRGKPSHVGVSNHASSAWKPKPEPEQNASQESKKTLHPSWEAARLRKQKMGAIPTNVKAQKVIFD
ncbi:uncharacterized protein L203_105679 [Cryptococcus depauperatus CBS 7841]|uniref:Uncharacterized protein n=1 Tax=Cryptococcus depauperatus CBS 7841 TaxID=1295531 RepID=A0A1E3IF83_9TREE|nr:hypothetical protein L203_03554 [Cryptococcus depauperatus CBS 7841]